MDLHNFYLNDYYKFISALGDYYKYLMGINGVILSYLIIKSYPFVVNLATKASFSIMLVGACCMYIDSWNRKSINYRLYVELYEDEYQALSDYKAGKLFVNLVFYILSIYFIGSTVGVL
jgi:hypothetical protein